MTTAHTDYRWDVPAAMQQFYNALEAAGFVNITAPTPDEWDHPAGYQVRLYHVARTTTISHRATPPGPPGNVHSVEGTQVWDRTFPYSTLAWSQNCPPAEFAGFLDRAARTIITSMKMHANQSRTSASPGAGSPR